MPVEIEVDLKGRGRATVQFESIRQRIGRGRGDGSGIRSHLNLHITGVEGPSLGIEVKVMVVIAGRAEGHRGLRGHGVALHGCLDLHLGNSRSTAPVNRGTGKPGILGGRGRGRGGRLSIRRHRRRRRDRRSRHARSIRQQGGDAAERNRRSGGRRSRHGGRRRGLLGRERHLDGNLSDLHGRRNLRRGELAVAVIRRREDDGQRDEGDDGPKGDNQLFRGHMRIQRTAGP